MLNCLRCKVHKVKTSMHFVSVHLPERLERESVSEMGEGRERLERERETENMSVYAFNLCVLHSKILKS